MSTPFPRNQHDPISLIPFDDALLDATVAGRAPARGTATSPASTNCPSRSSGCSMLSSPKAMFVPTATSIPTKPRCSSRCRGSALVVRYAENGTPFEGVLLEADGPVRGVEIPVGAWHSWSQSRASTVLFEAKEGPYVEATDKDFAPGHPPESRPRSRPDLHSQPARPLRIHHPPACRPRRS